MARLSFRQMQETDFEAVIELGNKVHGENYLTPENLADF